MGEVQENTGPAVNPVLTDFARLLSGDLSPSDAERALKAITEKARAATLAARDSAKKAADEGMAARGAWRDDLITRLRDVITSAHAGYRKIDPTCSTITYRIDVADDDAGNLTVVPVGFPMIKSASNGVKKRDDRKERRDVGIPREKNAIWTAGMKCSCGEQVMSRDTALAHRDQGHVIGLGHGESAPESAPTPSAPDVVEVEVPVAG